MKGKSKQINLSCKVSKKKRAMKHLWDSASKRNDVLQQLLESQPDDVELDCLLELNDRLVVRIKKLISKVNDKMDEQA